MIFVPILLVIYGLLGLVTAVMPVWHLPTQITSGFATIVGYTYVVNNFLPIDTLLQLLRWTIYIDGVMLIIWFILFVINYVRGR